MTETAQVLRIEVDKRNPIDGSVDIAWHVVGGTKGGNFAVDGEALARLNAELRNKALHQLQLVCDEAGSDATAAALQAVALGGAKLYAALTTGFPGKLRAKANADAFRTWFEAELLPAPSGAWRIEFILLEPGFVVAWGLIFTQRASEERAFSELGCGFEDYEAFWCCRFRVATYSLPDTSEPPVISGRDTSMTAVVERWDHDYTRLDSRIRAALRAANRLHGKTDTLIEHHLESEPEWHHIIYVSLRPVTELEAAAFDDIVDNVISDDSFKFLVLDHGAVVRGDRGDSWPKMMLNGKWSGLIAAETDITNARLCLAGFEFLMTALEKSGNRALADSLTEVRRSLWPQSLLYGVYCDPRRVIFSPVPREELITGGVLRALLMPFFQKDEAARQIS